MNFSIYVLEKVNSMMFQQVRKKKRKLQLTDLLLPIVRKKKQILC